MKSDLAYIVLFAAASIVDRVKVVLRSHGCNTSFGRPRYMSQREALNFKAQWDFNHQDSDYYISIEAA